MWGVFFCDTFSAAATGLFIFVYSIYVLELGGNGVEIGIIFSVSFVVASVSYLPGAYLIHRFDRKTIMISSMIIPAFSMYLLYIADSWVDVLIAEAIWFSNNYGAPAFIAYITEASSKEAVMSRFGLVYAGPALAYVVAPAGGFLIMMHYGSIRDIFPFAAALRILAPAFLLVIERQPPRTRSSKFVSLTRQLFSLDRKALERILFLVSVSAVLSMCIPYLPLFLSEVRAFSDTQVQILGSISYLGAAIMGIALGHMGDKKGGTAAVLAILAIFMLGCALLLGIDLEAAVIVAVFLLGIQTAVLTIMDSIVGLKSSAENIGGHLSIYLFAESLAMAPMPFIGGVLYDHLGQAWPFIVSSALAALLVVVALLRKDLTETKELVTE